MRTLVYLSSVFLLASLILGCNTDDDDFYGGRVVDMEVKDNTVEVGEGTVLRIDFSFDGGAVFGDRAHIVVTVRLPAELRYREGTAEIEEFRDDRSVGAQINECPDSSTFLVFDMDEYDLDDAKAPRGDADARLKLTVDGVFPGAALVEASAGRSRADFCGAPFPGEAGIVIQVR